MAEETQGLVAAYWPFRDVLDPDDSEYAPRGASCVKISDALGRIGEASSGLYAFGGSDCVLPALPGLVVRDAGVIPLPLAESFARCLLDRCTQVGQCWELPADQVWMKNPEWNRKMGDLGAAVGQKLGFQDALLDVILSKLVVFGPGGRVERRKDTAEDEEDVVATLVVQLPSLHEGGGLVVYDDKDAAKKYTFDFGQSTGTAAFKPSYAVFVAGAEYEVTEVKSGYRVVLEYSIRLPPDETVGVENRSRRFTQKVLKDAVAELGESNDAFALLLKNKYGDFEAFRARGEEQLAGVDHARFQALQKANNLVPSEKRLTFYISKMRHTANVVRDLGGDRALLYCTCPRIQAKGNGAVGTWWRIKETSEATVWLSANDGIVPNWDSDNAEDSALEWTSELNFLNPDHVSPREIWREHTACKIADVGQSIKYEAYALVGWPIAHDLENVLKFIGENAALETVLADVPVSAAKLREIMNLASGQHREANDFSDTIVSQYFSVSLEYDHLGFYVCHS